MTSIATIDAKLFHIPLAEVLVDAKHGDHTHFELVTTTITLKDGSAGTGYTYTGGKGGFAIAAMIERDLAPFLIGRDAGEVEALYEAMQVACPLCRPRRGRVLRDLRARYRALGSPGPEARRASARHGGRSGDDGARLLRGHRSRLSAPETA